MNNMGMGRAMGMEQGEPAESESNEPTSIFLTKEQLGGCSCKEGDTLTLKVDSIDPETGEVEAELVSGGEKESDMNQAIDQYMPEKEEES